MKESISQKYKKRIFRLIRLICLWELKVGVLISEVLENKYILIHILYVASLSFHILLPDAFLGSLFIDVHFHRPRQDNTLPVISHCQ